MGSPVKNITKIRHAVLTQLPRTHLWAVSLLAVSLLLILAVSPAPEAPIAMSVVTIAIPVIHAKTENTPNATHFELPNINNLFVNTNAKNGSAISYEPEWIELSVKSGDNLSSMFSQAGLNDRDLYELIDNNKTAKDLRNIVPGQKMAFLKSSQGKLQSLKYVKSILESVNFNRNAQGFSGDVVSLKPEVQHSFREGVINSSLFMAGKNAGLPNNLTMELANIFGFDIDFALDIQKGDRFKVMYEEQYLQGRKIGTGAILSAEFINDGRTYKALRYTNKEGITRYYTPDGKSMNKAFLRMPIEFARISSGFSLNRKHPVLNTIRAHKGTDYAAATGTPIRSTGDGKVMLAGRKGGYGNCVIIQHGQGYETLYGHLKSFSKGIRNGSRVNQGQVIGYVGQTGLASGPHLHYEFHVNGAVRNPVTVQLPQAIGIASNEKEQFNAATTTLIAQFQSFDNTNTLAAGERTSVYE
jgi:murein DD-endopeptidase MepM/ murein hydrolase activator NlpD